MKISLKPIKAGSEISSRLLRQGAEGLFSDSKSRNYVALRGSDEVGFISLDILPHFVVLYRIIVEPSFRLQGIGTEVLSEIEVIVRNLGYGLIRVHPEPFEGNIEREELVRWYVKHGFRHVPRSTLGEMEKDLNL